MAYTCNPSYLGGRKSGGSWFEASLSKQSVRPYLEKIHYNKRAGGVAQGVGTEFKSHTIKTKQNNK
jgi:hypothetical protein